MSNSLYSYCFEEDIDIEKNESALFYNNYSAHDKIIGDDSNDFEPPLES